MRIEGRDEHQTLVHDLCDVVSVRDDSLHAVGGERSATVSEKPHGSQDVRDHHRFEDVQFEMPVRAADGDGHVVAHHLSRDHRDRFALSRIHLS